MPSLGTVKTLRIFVDSSTADGPASSSGCCTCWSAPCTPRCSNTPRCSTGLPPIGQYHLLDDANNSVDILSIVPLINFAGKSLLIIRGCEIIDQSGLCGY